MPDIRFYNTLTHQVETFEPIEPGKVSMYNCGPTVYDFAHIGNFRAFVFADVLRRFLELVGYDVQQVMNITDVGHMTDDQLADGGGEDKMQIAARRLKEAKKSGIAPVDNPDDPYQVSRYYADAFIEDAAQLGLKIADEQQTHMPRATAYVDHMQKLIGRLIENDHAYVSDDGAVYYSVESYPDYGKLSGNTLDKLRGGAGGRVQDEHQATKRHPADFLLWKPDESHIMKWDSPWGTGYPGWHIECSAMATAVLGKETIDIHTGGEDNIFPHHECEIAQSCGATGESHFARFWMHTRFLLVEGEKMSKSKGNFFTVRDLLDKGIDPAVIRFELLKAHYRSNMNFTLKGLEDSGNAVRRLRELEQHLVSETDDTPAEVDNSHPVLTEVIEQLSDDLNLSGALGTVFKWAKEDHKSPGESLAVLRAVDSVINVLQSSGVAASELDQPQADDFCKQIDDARKSKDYDTADTLREKLNEAGYDVKNTPDGTVAVRRLA